MDRIGAKVCTWPRHWPQSRSFILGMGHVFPHTLPFDLQCVPLLHDKLQGVPLHMLSVWQLVTYACQHRYVTAIWASVGLVFHPMINPGEVSTASSLGHSRNLVWLHQACTDQRRNPPPALCQSGMWFSRLTSQREGVLLITVNSCYRQRLFEVVILSFYWLITSSVFAAT